VTQEGNRVSAVDVSSPLDGGRQVNTISVRHSQQVVGTQASLVLFDSETLGKNTKRSGEKQTTQSLKLSRNTNDKIRTQTQKKSPDA